jgi:hypothetical protein
MSGRRVPTILAVLFGLSLGIVAPLSVVLDKPPPAFDRAAARALTAPGAVPPRGGVPSPEPLAPPDGFSLEAPREPLR